MTTLVAPQPTPTREWADERPSLVERSRAWVLDHRWGIVTLTAVLVVAALTATINLANYPAHFIDEGTYTAQAWAVLTRGELAHYTFWYDHPPVGWIVLAGMMAVTGGFEGEAIVAGRQAIAVFHLATCALLFLWARRVGMRLPFAALAVLVYTLSPLAIYYHRQVLLDNLAMPMLVGAFALAASPKSRLSAMGAAAGLFALACLSKETSVLVLPALLWQMNQTMHDSPARGYAFALAGSVYVFLMSFYILMAVLRGELLPGEGHVSLVDGILFQLVERPEVPASFATGTSLGDWLAFDGITVVAMAAAAAISLFVRRLRPAAVAAGIIVAMTFVTSYLPVMFVMSLLPFGAIALAGVADVVAGRRWQTIALSLALVAVGAFAIYPYWSPVLRWQASVNDNAPMSQATGWIRENLTPEDRLLTDDSMRLNLALVNEYWAPADIVWFYKLDQDPEVAADNPGGWRDFDYIVTTDTLRNDETIAGGQVRQAIENSVLVTGFEPPPDYDGYVAYTQAVDIRRIVTDPQELAAAQDARNAYFDRFERTLLARGMDEQSVEEAVAAAEVTHGEEIYATSGAEVTPKPSAPDADTGAGFPGATAGEAEGTGDGGLDGPAGFPGAAAGGPAPDAEDGAAPADAAPAPHEEAEPVPLGETEPEPDPFRVTRTVEEYELEEGDTGRRVAQMQRRLLDWNSDALPDHGTDGIWGEETQAAYERYLAEALQG